VCMWVCVRVYVCVRARVSLCMFVCVFVYLCVCTDRVEAEEEATAEEE